MTSHTSSKPGWRRAVAGAVASGALTAGLIAGFGSGTASADVLDDIYAQYDTGSAGGQVSVLVHSSRPWPTRRATRPAAPVSKHRPQCRR